MAKRLRALLIQKGTKPNAEQIHVGDGLRALLIQKGTKPFTKVIIRSEV